MSIVENHPRITRIVLAVAVLLTIPMVARPWYLHWGATDGEIERQWPGDELTSPGSGNATRAITIRAPAEQVWPWIVQIGQDRGGFYSYTWLENLFRCRMRNAESTVPGWQSRQVGDTVWTCDRTMYDGRGRTVVAGLVANRAMILAAPGDAEAVAKTGQAPNGTWGFVLDAVDGHQTRLIMRSRRGAGGGILEDLWDWFVFDPAHFIMERRMMIGIKERAERSASGRKQAGPPPSQKTTA